MLTPSSGIFVIRWEATIGCARLVFRIAKGIALDLRFYLVYFLTRLVVQLPFNPTPFPSLPQQVIDLILLSIDQQFMLCADKRFGFFQLSPFSCKPKAISSPSR